MQSTLSKCLDTPPMAATHGPKSAVFFDAENISARKAPAILSYLRGRGDIPVIRAYADFSKSTASSWCALFRHTPITAVQVCRKANPFPYWTASGEDVDKAIFMDAPIIALTHSGLDEIVIVSSDGGYHALATKLRELGKNVLGIGERAKSSSVWTEACNEFCCIEDLPPAKEDADSGEDTEGQSIADGTEETEAEEGEEYKPYIEGIVDYVMKDNVHDSGISYGFIKTEGGEEYFFNHDDTWHELQRGDRVQFIAGRPYNAKAASPRERRGRATHIIQYAWEQLLLE